MLTAEENERLTRVGPGTPMGNTFRRYWNPALLSSELPERDGAPIRLRILGEDLIAFRDTEGKVGLVSAFCPHRRAPMFFGRNEECGLRCVYHGWKFDVSGACVDMPSEPPDSLFKNKVRIESYPTREVADVIWTYMGPPEQEPEFPDYEWMRAPATHRHMSKTFESANWLQALEGGLDTAHSSFLHNEDIKNNAYLRSADTAPKLEVDKTPYGYCYVGIRKAGDRDYVRIYHYVMPAQQMRGFVQGNRQGEDWHVPSIHGHLWIPIDDENTWSWNWMYSYDEAKPIGGKYAHDFEVVAGRGPDDLVPGTFRLKKNLENNYLIDRQLQKTKTYTGIVGINTQDIMTQEGMGPICDRTKEHLGTTDRAVITTRQLLLEATDEVEAGRAPRGLNPADSRNVRAGDDFKERDADWRVALKDQIAARF
jgi:phenylpropionate dioxygenase-like ring-hydroxylating dioxygenase large terminal subunit